MTSSPSSSPRTWRYRVFTSFHGPDVRKTFLSHVRKEFSNSGISMFNDQRIERGQTIAPALTEAIRESRMSIVVLSKNYASSSWCLDELLEILNCKKVRGQKVMTVFYGVDPSDVRNQSGDFGNVFSETCARKTEEKRQKWSQALTYVSTIAGEHFQNWNNESEMIEKLARDVSNKLNTTICKDFEDMVGIEVHLQKMQSLLHLDNKDEAMIVGIYGPAGIGKTTITRALHSRLSSSFELTCFMENLRGSYDNGLDEYGLKLRLQEQLLSKILNKNGMRICHLGEIPERLYDQKVLIILDDVDSLKQLEALANETIWFGPGSRIIVTTEDQELLKKHNISNTYLVEFPTEEEARKIFCRYAFRQSSAPDGFIMLADRVLKLCSKLPLGLRVTGSFLRGKNEMEWEVILHRLENSLDPEIEGVLKLGYDNLHKNDQLLFLLIAFFFNYEDDDHVVAMLGENNSEARLGLETLARKSLIQVSTKGKIVMHKLLQQVGREAVQRQEPWKRQILIDADEIRNVLKDDSGGSSVAGISFDISRIQNVVYISAEAFKNMHNLQFLSFYYKTRRDTNVRVHVPKNMDFPPRLRLLHWEAYPEKSLPYTFRPEYLVEFNLENNKLLKLWEGSQPLPNLKKMNLSNSWSLTKLPDLSSAINLERLDIRHCYSLVEIPSSCGNLHKLEWLEMEYCVRLQVVPTHFNLASLKEVHMLGCRRFRKIPEISTNISSILIADTMLEQVPESISLWSRIRTFCIFGRASLEVSLEQTGRDIERLPDWIKDLHGLKTLYIVGCPKLASLPELPPSLIRLIVDNCKSLETLVPFPFDSPIEYLYFPNCFSLGREARSVITQQVNACLPGKKLPANFDHRTEGNSLTIRSDFYAFRFCAVVPQTEAYDPSMLCRIRINGFPTDRNMKMVYSTLQKAHLFMSYFDVDDKDGWLERDNEISFEFITTSHEIKFAECGVQILTEEDEPDGSISNQGSYESRSEQVSEEDNESLSDGSSESCSQQVSEEDNGILSDGSSESCSEQGSDEDDETLRQLFREQVKGSARFLQAFVCIFLFFGFSFIFLRTVARMLLFFIRKDETREKEIRIKMNNTRLISEDKLYTCLYTRIVNRKSNNGTIQL